MTDIAFHPITDFPRGTLLRLLQDGYAFDGRYEAACLDNWRECDGFFYDHPAIAATCCFVTALGDTPVGFVCWDPRALPESAEIGHNCVSAQYKGRGFGKRQMREAVRRILLSGAQSIRVTTNSDLVPAQRTYEAAGFVLQRTRESDGWYQHLDYLLTPQSAAQQHHGGNEA